VPPAEPTEINQIKTTTEERRWAGYSAKMVDLFVERDMYPVDSPERELAAQAILDASPLSEAEPYGDCLTHPNSHFDFWTEQQRLGVVPRDVEYESGCASITISATTQFPSSLRLPSLSPCKHVRSAAGQALVEGRAGSRQGALNMPEQIVVGQEDLIGEQRAAGTTDQGSGGAGDGCRADDWRRSMASKYRRP
jgi:hypothetical protein